MEVVGEGIQGGKVDLKGSASSQFLTALLMASPLAVGEDVEVVITDTLVSQPYVDMTVKLMEKFGVKVDRLDGLQHLKVSIGETRVMTRGEKGGRDERGNEEYIISGTGGGGWWEL